MTALFSAGWSGMAVIDDIDKGILDRFLVSPVVRGSLIIGRLMNGTVIIVVQSLIIVGLALIVGARFPNAWGIIVLIALASLLAAAVGCLSIALGADRAPRGDADRGGELLRPAAHVPVDGVHAAEPRAAVDPARGLA